MTDSYFKCRVMLYMYVVIFWPKETKNIINQNVKDKDIKKFYIKL